MKICFFNLTAGYKRGGLETYCWEVGRALALQGHKVTIVAGEGGASRHDCVGLQSFPFVSREKLPNFGTRFRKLAERLSFARRSVDWVLAQNFDAIVVNKPFDFPAIWWLRRHGWRGVAVFRSGGEDFFLGDRYFSSAIDTWLSTSKFNANEVISRFKRPVGVLPNGVDADRFHPPVDQAALRIAAGLSPDSFVLVSCGRLIGLKGLGVIIKALPGLPGCEFLVIGEGPERAKLEMLSEQLGVSSRIHFVGGQEHCRLPDLLGAGDLFVQPTVGEEAFGISVVEAMACGLPVLASNVGGLPEVVADKESGYLLPPGEVEVWRQQIQQLRSETELRKKMGLAARLRVLAKFSWMQNGQRLVELIQSAREPN